MYYLNSVPPVYNGFVMATIYCPPINRLWFTPRAATLANLSSAFPKETAKSLKTRMKKEKDKRARLQLEAKERKELTVTCALTFLRLVLRY